MKNIDFIINYKTFFKQNKYISVKDKIKFINDNKKLINNEVENLLINLSDNINIHNKRFVNNKIKYDSNYFLHIFENVDNNIKLDNEQIEVIVTDEDNLLVVAGAGSGKTTTMTAKVKYLVDKLMVNPNEIIIISFTNQAVNELKQRINKDFNIPTKICTFHKFGMEIIKNNINSNLNILTNNYDIINDYFKKQMLYQKKLYRLIKYYPMYFKIKTKDIILNKIKIKKYKNEDYKDFIYYCCNFIDNLKLRGYKLEQISNLKGNNRKINYMLKVVYHMYSYYEFYLKENNLIDFSDMINKAYDILNTQKRINFNYKYIIIDEYQDISKERFKLLKKLSNLCGAKLIAVGDDWQSIFSFSGSEVSLFTEFEKLMGNAKILRITHTYRNSQELIDIAGNFVMKNKFQLKKKLISSKRLNNPIKLIEYTNLIEALYKCIQIIIEKSSQSNILIIGRYNHDLNTIIDNNYFKYNGKIIVKNYENVDVKFLTAHSSKGLTFDNVIVINNNDNIYGFPSKVIDDPLINLINKKEENFVYAEERRLFYVAITRTKNYVYLLYEKKKESLFIKELLKQNNGINNNF